MGEEITFIIPSVNRPSLVKSLVSLERQTNPCWRCIVIYDGVTGPVINHDRIRFIHTQKTGLVGPANGQAGLVRNIGINQCSTSWIGFLDDDDTLHEDYVATLFDKYSHLDFVVWRMRYQNGVVLPPIGSDELRFARVGISFCFKRSLGELRFDCNRDGEDFDFLKKLKQRTDNFVVAPEVFYNVRH
jgi:glycosyltransferase involved in cell wall biosynthesis